MLELKHGYYKVSDEVFKEITKTAVGDSKKNIKKSAVEDASNLFYVMLRKESRKDGKKFNAYCRLTPVLIASVHGNGNGYLGTGKKERLNAPEGIVVLYVMPIKAKTVKTETKPKAAKVAKAKKAAKPKSAAKPKAKAKVAKPKVVKAEVAAPKAAEPAPEPNAEAPAPEPKAEAPAPAPAVKSA
jgi:hypothetical protein